MKKFLLLVSSVMLFGIQTFAVIDTDNPVTNTGTISNNGLTINSLQNLNGSISIDLNFATGSVCNQVQVMSISGEVFYNNTFNTPSGNITFNSDPGVYLIVCKNNNTVIKQTVLIK